MGTGKLRHGRSGPDKAYFKDFLSHLLRDIERKKRVKREERTERTNFLTTQHVEAEGVCKARRATSYLLGLCPTLKVWGRSVVLVDKCPSGVL